MTLRFFLGGQDLEMRTIRALLEAEGAAFIDRSLPWGARLSDYRGEIEAAHAAGETPVAVELADDMPAEWPPRARLVLADHHGARAAEPPALKQVFALLTLPEARWSRNFALVAANDAAHVRGMRAMGASTEEMLAIRAADRAAQGITPAEEAAGLAALAAGTPVLGGQAVRVTLPHDRAATVTDPHAIDPRFAALPRALIVLGPATGQVFGPRRWIDALSEAFPQGWSGGAGAEGFFGAPRLGWAEIAPVLLRLT